MHQLFTGDRAATHRLLDAVLDRTTAYFRTLPRRPAGVSNPDTSALRELALPDSGPGAGPALDRLLAAVEPLVAATTSHRYLGYVTGGVTPAALAADWLTSLYDQLPQGLADAGDVSAHVERHTIALLRELLGVSPNFDGGFVTGATMSNFTCLGAARQWLGRRQGYDVAATGLRQPMTVFAATPHSSATKALSMLGLGRNAVTEVATLPDREAMDVADLARRAAALDGAPFVVVASAGTVNTVDFDDFAAILDLRDRFDFWLHIDAAFGGFAGLLSDDFVARTQVQGGLLRQWNGADSITVDNHKWLNVPYDSGTWFVRADHRAAQRGTFRNGNAAYLNVADGDYTYLDVGPENSRRLRALPVLATLLAYGRAGYRDVVERCVATALALGEALAAHPAFELLAPVRLNVVAFTLAGRPPREVDAFCARLAAAGRYFLTPTTLAGRRGLRAAFVNWQHEPTQVPALMAALTAVLTADQPARP